MPSTATGQALFEMPIAFNWRKAFSWLLKL
jgi:hypothetical protein